MVNKSRKSRQTRPFIYYPVLMPLAVVPMGGIGAACVRRTAFPAGTQLSTAAYTLLKLVWDEKTVFGFFGEMEKLR